MTYEAPSLAQVGKAEEVIRGTYEIGTDIDGHSFIGEFEFLNDDSLESAGATNS